MTDKQQTEAGLKSLYQITGEIADINTILVNRGEFHRLQVEQEPVAVVDFTTEGWRKIVDALRTLPDGAQLYTRPQNLQCKSTQARLATLWGYVKEQPKLEPLTESAIVDIVIDMNGNEPTALFWRDLARAIEAAHDIGNKG